jgi:hypothetical protein
LDGLVLIADIIVMSSFLFTRAFLQTFAQSEIFIVLERRQYIERSPRKAWSIWSILYLGPVAPADGGQIFDAGQHQPAAVQEVRGSIH